MAAWGGCSVAGRCHGLGSTAARGTGLSGPLPALLPRAPVRSKACLRLVLELESADFCPTLWVSGRVVLDDLCQMSPEIGRNRGKKPGSLFGRLLILN